MSKQNRKTKTGLKTAEFKIGGMECNSCEKIIERQARAVGGVTGVDVDYVTGAAKITYDPNTTNPEEISGKISEKGYSCFIAEEKTAGGKSNGVKYATLLLGAAVILLGAYALSGAASSFSMPALEQNTSLFLLFTVGLLTGFHCVAMCGGFVVSYSAKDAKEGRISYGSHITYGLSKTLSYTLLGALFGFVGSFFTFTPFMRGAAALLAGVFLVLFGLNMLDLLTWFRRFRLKTPSLVNRLASKRAESRSPMTIGLLNGLMIACGPLQAVYVLAAASGSAYYGALYLAAFGLGTLPVLLGFGVVTSMVSSRLTRTVVRYSGVVVILLGLVMLNRGLSLTGSGYDLNTIMVSARAQDDSAVAGLGNVSVNIDSAGFQEIRMNVTRYGWQPDKFVLKKGVPVKWIIDGQELTSCNNAIQVPKLGLKFDVKPGLQTIEFTPAEAGVIPWSCWMGMIHGTFIVREDAGVSGGQQNQETSDPAPAASTTTTTIKIQKPAEPAQTVSEGYQTIRMNVTAGGWSPNKFVLKTGVPVKWVIDGQQITGCNRAIKVPSMGLKFDIKPGLQTIEFTPSEAGTIPWSCWMGMIKGSFIVKDDIDPSNTRQVQAELDKVQLPAGGGGCGCGMM